MSQKTEGEIECSLSYLLTGLNDLKKHFSDSYNIPYEDITVVVANEGTIAFSKDLGNTFELICQIKDLPKTIKEQSEHNYNTVKPPRHDVKKNLKALEEIRLRQFNAILSLKLIKPTQS